jgi:hypothetical protein
MSIVSSQTRKRATRRAHSLAAAAALVVAGACGMGVAAFAGLLPASEGVAVAMTPTPLIDIQLNGVR